MPMRRVPIEKRIDATAGPDACWPWTGYISPDGYGRYLAGMASRASYEHFVGPIPEGLQIDHLCRNTVCVNPSHLEPVTGAENMRRRYALQTHCKNGHEFTPENTYLRTAKSVGVRDCRKCIAAAQRRYQARKRAA